MYDMSLMTAPTSFIVDKSIILQFLSVLQVIMASRAFCSGVTIGLYNDSTSNTPAMILVDIKWRLIDEWTI